jgi:serine/threonine protein kinase
VTLQAGQLFGNYGVVRLIGEGGFGEVYLVENPLIQRCAAVKVLHPALAKDSELVRRFLNEARAASAICHPNIIEVFDAGAAPDGAPYILMEFLEGVSLQRRLADRGRLAMPDVLDIASQAGSALVAAHAAGIVHRDLKPENLFLVPDAHRPSGDCVKILDFGIAKIKHSSGSGGTVQTRTGMIVGSPAYMSPEQCRDSADVDVRSDVYSFATILYEMLTGRTPHVAATGTELLFMHLTKTPRPLRELAPDVSINMATAIMRGLARERADRFDSMAAFVAAFGEDLTAPGTDLKLPAAVPSGVAPSLVTNINRTATPATSTTFSRATGEIGESAEIESRSVLATRNRRWTAIGLSAAALLGGAILVMSRPSRHPTPRPSAVGPSSTSIVRPVVPIREEATRKAEPPSAIPGSADSDAQNSPETVAKVLPSTKPLPTASSTSSAAAKKTRQATRRSASSPYTKEWNSDERWLAH